MVETIEDVWEMTNAIRKAREDLTFWEVFEHFTYPEYLKLRKKSNIPLTKEQEKILDDYNYRNCE